MATPFVTGALARYLQTVASVPTNSTTGQTAAWNWLSTNATLNAITYFNVNRLPQTANRLLFVPSGIPPQQVTSLTALPTNSGAVVSWLGSVAGVTYTATATPGSATCSTVGGTTCTLMGLTNGSSYTISVTGTNNDGTSPAASTTVVAGLPPEAPSTFATSSKNAAVGLTWTASSVPGATYIVTSSPPSGGCTTTATACTISGLKNGTNYTFSISTKSTTGLQSVAPKTVSVRPGFVVKKSTVKKGSRTLLSWILTTPSRGRKTWSETGACYLSAGRLVAPRRATSCYLKLTVAKAGSYPKMSTTLKVTVK